MKIKILFLCIVSIIVIYFSSMFGDLSPFVPYSFLGVVMKNGEITSYETKSYKLEIEALSDYQRKLILNDHEIIIDVKKSLFFNGLESKFLRTPELRELGFDGIKYSEGTTNGEYPAISNGSTIERVYRNSTFCVIGTNLGAQGYLFVDIIKIEK